jgi:DNA-binding LytR/AlgR family response regulator
VRATGQPGQEAEGVEPRGHQSIERQRALDRIPIWKGREVWLLPVDHIASIVADGEWLHISTVDHQRHTINHRLKDLEARLGARFVRLGRGTLVNLGMIVKVHILPRGMHVAVLTNGEEIQVGRLQARNFRKRFLRL